MTLTSELDIARYKASAVPESNIWLNTLPSKTIGLLLDNNTFRISISLRLGTNICVPHTCICGTQVDSSGIHGLSCSMSAGRHSRHSSLNEIIHRSLASAKYPAMLEPVGLRRDDNKRPDGMTLVPWTKGQMLVWDATCTDSLAPSHVNLSSKTGGAVAESAAVETLGPWCREARNFVECLGKRIASITGEPRATSYLRQKISIAIQRGNAASVMGTLPTDWMAKAHLVSFQVSDLRTKNHFSGWWLVARVIPLPRSLGEYPYHREGFAFRGGIIPLGGTDQAAGILHWSFV
ncbi:uncharacterized protein LOC116161558 [Photinus pyralis]|uniref:uncharacterized protein LOC116161558 n=1 Tax=Photinus pyralis TaxID=7054 RepID=UPI00126769DD|nr:uncharacterized protein LOC116161558 [Photinus pyralis]